jgi:hypothetical protein
MSMTLRFLIPLVKVIGGLIILVWAITSLLAIFKVVTLFLAIPLPNVTDNWDAIGNAGDWTSALATIAGFFFLWQQIKREREVLEVQTNAQVYETGIAVLNLFIEKEHNLRPYFYDCVPVPNIVTSESEPKHNRWEWDRVMTACEIMCDQWENIYSSQTAMSKDISEVWVSYMRGLYLTSPSLRYFLIQEGYRYDNDFINLFHCDLHECSKQVRLKIETLVKKNLTENDVKCFPVKRHEITQNAINQLKDEFSVAN